MLEVFQNKHFQIFITEEVKKGKKRIMPKGESMAHNAIHYYTSIWCIIP